MPRLAAALLLLALLPPAASAATVAGVTLPEVASLDTTAAPLLLNGAGIRSKYFIHIYVGALYLPMRTADARQALAMPGPKRMVLHFLYRQISPARLTQAWNEGVADNLTPAARQAVQARLDRFNALVPAVHRGDELRLDFRPATGTAVVLNGRRLGVIPGADFFHALLAVWLGDHPADGDLKRDLLGGG